MKRMDALLIDRDGEMRIARGGGGGTSFTRPVPVFAGYRRFLHPRANTKPAPNFRYVRYEWTGVVVESGSRWLWEYVEQ